MKLSDEARQLIDALEETTDAIKTLLEEGGNIPNSKLIPYLGVVLTLVAMINRVEDQ